MLAVFTLRDFGVLMLCIGLAIAGVLLIIAGKKGWLV